MVDNLSLGENLPRLSVRICVSLRNLFSVGSAVENIRSTSSPIRAFTIGSYVLRFVLEAAYGCGT
ncbi:hypothetical protein BABINDRAFT_163470 [Babjeviella inositovora NRRL Y-12698]|uniref:Uncharacterized protein n=1 Tax=Babjeviella inositovora NRRL Y-12698 TaxID=984486 RepID=A0A1E3QID1_9ASCO|nr:uncharacterized protein BABINDRAFT_163470 [Babjeviella inositovora NRRL Y-12698]ODQ77455.1 hypothetical protein BABINDRAFT_163470 [Babjeviella inositovora NRRL Y-12698]